MNSTKLLINKVERETLMKIIVTVSLAMIGFALFNTAVGALLALALYPR